MPARGVEASGRATANSDTMAVLIAGSAAPLGDLLAMADVLGVGTGAH
ncbi:MAG: hypothetical protein ACYCX8_01575 [Acidimicrobiales bacterium]